MRWSRILSVAAILVCAALPSCLADQVVYFVNGKAILVKSVEKGEKFTVLEMEGGGRIGVPTDQINRIEEYAVSPPPAVTAPAAPVLAGGGVAAVQAPVTAGGPQVGVPSGAPQLPPMVPGPGMGGKPLGGPNQNLAGLQPLGIGGDNAPSGPQRPPSQAGAGPSAGGPRPGGVGARPDFAGRRFGGRQGLAAGGRGMRQADLNRLSQPAARTVQPVQATPLTVIEAPPPGDAATEPPQPPDDSNEEPSDPPESEEGDSSGSPPGSAS